MAFCTLGPIWSQDARLARWGRSTPFPHAYRKIGQFFRMRVFPATQARLCVDGPCKTAGHLQNTPGTPAMDFPLGAFGSQSALYKSVRANRLCKQVQTSLPPCTLMSHREPARCRAQTAVPLGLCHFAGSQLHGSADDDMGHTYTGHTYTGHTYTGHISVGHNYMGITI